MLGPLAPIYCPRWASATGILVGEGVRVITQGSPVGPSCIQRHPAQKICVRGCRGSNERTGQMSVSDGTSHQPVSSHSVLLWRAVWASESTAHAYAGHFLMLLMKSTTISPPENRPVLPIAAPSLHGSQASNLALHASSSCATRPGCHSTTRFFGLAAAVFLLYRLPSGSVRMTCQL